MAANPSMIVSHENAMDDGPAACEHFDNREDGWTKVMMHPKAA
jgi:glutathione-independent formaldehyde dehydrogenase